MHLPDIRAYEELAGKRVLLRAELNVPIKDGIIINDFRIQRAIPTIKFLSERGAKVIVIAHIGRDPSATLAPVHSYLSKHIHVSFVRDIVGKEAHRAVDNLSEGGVLLFENLRSKAGEANNDEGFAKELASFGELYVNDAFAASHREHASIVSVPALLPHYAGIGLQEEVEHLEKGFTPESPSLLIIAGAKFETKLPLIKKFLNIYDTVFVGGAVVHDLFRAQGLEVGKSLVSGRSVDEWKELLTHKNLMLPSDVSVKTNEGRVETKKPEHVLDNDKILDAGPETTRELSQLVKETKTILWNGPLGSYEEGFSEHTETIAKLIAKYSAYSIIGGGDTVASVAALNLEDKFSFVSTGGGAMLEFFLDGTLSGIEALRL